MIPLNFLTVGEKGVIDNIIGGKGVTMRLIEMGINKGSQVEIIRNEGGRIIVSLGGCRLALGRGIAQKIMINL